MSFKGLFDKFATSGRLAVLTALLVLMFLSLSSSVVLAQSSLEELKISSIETAGNLTVSRSKILSSIVTRVGQYYDESAVAGDVSKIAKLDGVEYAYYNAKETQGRVVLTFVIVEKNIIRGLAIVGNKKLKDRKLRKAADLKLGDYIDSFTLQNAIEDMLEQYHKKGYHFADISIDAEKLNLGIVYFNVQEGPKVKVKDIVFEGNYSFKDSELIKALKLRKKKMLIFPQSFVQDLFETDAEKLREIYQKKGFLDTLIVAEPVFSEDKKTVEVRYVIREGAVYYIDDIEISGNEYFSEQELLNVMRLKQDARYNSEFAEFDQKKVKDLFLEQGFIDVNVDFERQFISQGKTKVVYDIEQGDRFKIGKIDITGNVTTHDKVVRRVLDESGFRPGKWYNGKIASGTGKGDLEYDVRRSALADSAFITPTDGGQGQKDAQVNITEGQTGMIIFGAGIDSNDGAIGQIIVEQRNFDIGDWPSSMSEFLRGRSFKGAGQQMRLSLEPGTQLSRFSLNFTEPFLNDRPVSMNVSASKYSRGRENYYEDRLRGYVGFERRFIESKWRAGVAFRGENVDVNDIDDDAPKEVTDVEGATDLYGMKFYVRRENTDNKYIPTTGEDYEVSVEEVMGDFTYTILSGTYRWYHTLAEDLSERKTVLETKFQASSIVGGDAPLFEKFYGGGNRSIRGFDYRGVSPRGINPITGEEDDPVGSDWIVVANTEIVVPMASDTFAALFFFDAGMVETGGIRTAIGTGIQIMLPQWFGPVPMRFELAAPLSKDETDETKAFSFSVGRLF